MAGLTLSVAAAPLRSPQRSMASLAVVVEAHGSDLFFANADEKFNGAMELAIVASDLDGKIQVGERGSLTMRLSPETHETVTTQGVRILSSLELKPGRYHVKVAATDAGGGQTRGVVQHDVTVPDLWKGPLAMSGIALGSVAASRTPTNGSTERWQQALGMAPPTTREFAASDELRAYVEVYVSAGRPVDVTTTVRSVSGRTVFTRRQRLSLAPAQTAQEVVTAIPLKDIAPGEYVLVVEAARGLALPDQPAPRQIPFTILHP